MNNKFKSMILSSSIVLSMLSVSTNASTFTDMPEDYSTDALKKAVDNGLLVGHNGLLNPDANLSRAEFATILVNSFGAKTSTSLTHTNDVDTGDWYHQSFSRAVAMGAFSKDDNFLRPTEAITRQEMCLALARTLSMDTADAKVIDTLLFTLNDTLSASNNTKISSTDTISRKDFAVILDTLFTSYITESGLVSSVESGNIMVNSPDVILDSVTISGNLIIGDGVGTGAITLNDVTVEGEILVRSNATITLQGTSQVTVLNIAEVAEKANVIVEADSTIDTLNASSSTVTITNNGTINSSNIPSVEESETTKPSTDDDSFTAEEPVKYAHELLDVMTGVTENSGWKVQLPLWKDDTAMSVLEKTGKELIDEDYESDIFYVTYEDDRNWLVMDCGVDGAKTANTSYSRNEFREMIDITSSAANWEYTGTHILNTTQKVTKVPSTGITVTSQIHGVYRDGENGPVLVKVEYDYKNRAVVVLLKTACDMNAADARYYFYGVELDQIFDTEIKVTGGSLYVTVSSEGRSETYYTPFAIEDPNWYDVLGYFKCGNYVQDSNLDYEGEGATVYVNRMDVYHGEEDQDIKVENISFSNQTVDLGLGEAIGLSVNFSPIDTLNKGLTWEIVSGHDVLAVTNTGTIVGLSEGSATIRATSTENTSISTECTVNVTARGEVIPEIVYKPSLTMSTETDRDLSGIDVNAGSDQVRAELVKEDDEVIIQIDDSDELSTGRAEIHFDPQYTTTTISYDIRVDSSEIKGSSKPQTSNIYMDFGGNEGATLTSSTQAFRIRNNADNTTDTIYNNRWGYTHSYSDVPRNFAASEFEIGQWKNITIIITPDDGTASANTTTVYMDGQRVSELTNNNCVVEMINQVNIYVGTADQAGFSLKNVEVSSGAKVPESTASAPTKVTHSTLPTVMSVGNSIQVLGGVNDGANETLAYSISSGSALAISQSGLLVAREVGTATVRISSALDSSVYTDWDIEVLADVVSVESIELDETAIKMNPFQEDDDSSTYPTTYDLTKHLIFAPENASEHAVSYTITSGSDYISISEEGMITAHAVGAATVRVTSLDNPNATATIAINVFNDYTKGQEIFRDEFSGTTLDYNNWTSATSNVGNTVTAMEQGALFFEDNNVGGQPKSYIAFEPQGETFTIQYDFVLHRDYYLSRSSSVNMAFGSGSITSSANEAFRLRTYVGNSGADNYFRYHDVDGSNNIDLKDTADMLNLNEWVTIALTTTPDNGETNANTTSLYINGELVAENVPNKLEMPTIDQFIFQTGTSDLTSYSVDNFTVWAGSYEDGCDNDGYAAAQRTGTYEGYVSTEVEGEEETTATPETTTPETTETPSTSETTAPTGENSWTVPVDSETNWSGISGDSGSTTQDGESAMKLVTTPGTSVNMHYKLEDAIGTSLVSDNITLSLKVMTENTAENPASGFKLMNGGTSSSNNVSRFKFDNARLRFEGEGASFVNVIESGNLPADGVWTEIVVNYTAKDGEILANITIDGKAMGEFTSGSLAASLNDDGNIELTHFTLYADSGSTDGTFYYKDISFVY